MSVDNCLKEAERIIMQSFAGNFVKPGDIITSQKLLNIKNNTRNPKVRDCLKQAIESLIVKGFLEKRKDGQIALTQEGYTTIA
ncbi:MAG TPA: hypothetical protein IAA58_09275 [Candidatus Gallacutalibacter stercoravium]|nr:hypothetical protein [Candidatus Gallacutalibacter stercoravium]